MPSGPTIKDIYWLAALFEGEGCFMVNTTPRMKIGMSDEDIIERASKLFKHKYNKREDKNGNKTIYIIELCGSKAVQWMMTIYPIMGKRRQSKIKQILEIWKNHPLMGMGAGYHNSLKTHCAQGHQFSEENTFLRKNGGRGCIICRREAVRRNYAIRTTN